MRKKLSMRIISLICCFALLLSSIVGTVIITTAALSIEELAVEAFKEYVMQAGNNTSAQAALEAVNKAIAPSVATIDSLDEDFFILHSIDGVYDEGDNNYPINLEGKNGYVSAIFNINGDKKVGAVATIYSYVENLGKLTTDVYTSSNSNFITENGNIIGYNGNAEKIVIPAEFSGNINLKDSTNKDNVKVVYIGGKNADMKIGIENNSFNNWQSLRAVILPATKIKGNIGEYAFANNAKLKYLSLPLSVSGSSGSGYGAIDRGAFSNNPVLSAVHCSDGLSLPSAQYRNYVFSGTTIRGYYLPTWFQYASGGSQSTTFGYNPSFTEGTTVVMTSAQQATASFARAAVLAQAAADSYKFNSVTDTADTVKTAITKAYSSKNSGVTADWNNTYKKEGSVVSGTLTLTYNNKSFEIFFENNPNKVYFLLKLEGDYELTPEFDSETFEYYVTVPNSVTSLIFSTSGSKIDSITGNENFTEGSENRICITVKDASGTPIDYFINVTRLVNPETITNKVRDAFNEYVAAKGNEVKKSELIAYIDERIVPHRVKIEDNTKYFNYHSTDGVYDEDDSTYPIAIKGHDGYISAIFSLYDKDENFVSNVGAVASIYSTNENLGVLTTDVYSKENTNFITDADGNIAGYKGNAEKIVIPSDFSGEINLKNCDGKNNVKAVFIGGNNSSMYINIANESFSGWENLRAVVLPEKMYGSIGEYAFAGNSNLKYVLLPTTVTGSNGSGYGYIQIKAFANNTKLETAYGRDFTMPSARFYRGVFDNTAIRDYYLATWQQLSGATQNEVFGNNPSFTAGEGKVLTSAEAGEFNFVKAAGLAKNEADNYLYNLNSDTSATLKNAITATYSSKIAGVAADWKDTFSVQGSSVSGVLTLSTSDADFKIEFFYDDAVAVKKLNIGGAALSPTFESDVYSYSADVTNNTFNLPVGIKLAPGASLLEVQGNSELNIGVNFIVIKVKAPNNVEYTYEFKVNRAEATSLDNLAAQVKNAVLSLDFNNNSDKSDISAVVSKVVENELCTASVEDFYLYQSIGGAKEDNIVLVPGHNGYVSVVIKLSNGKETRSFGITKSIPAEMENYTFNSVSKESDFTLSDDGKKLITYMGEAEKVVIPEGVEEIDPLWLFSDTSIIKCIIFPNSLKGDLPSCQNLKNLEVVYIGDQITNNVLFTDCPSLKYIRLSENLHEFLGSAFAQTISLGQLYIPQSVTKIATNAFYKTLIRDITIGKHVTTIGNYCFAWPVNRANVFVSASQGALISAEKAQELQTNVLDKWVYKNGLYNNRKIVILNPDVSYGHTLFSHDNTGAWGVNDVYTLAGSTIEAYLEETNWKNINIINMGLAECAARAQFAADGLKLTASATAEEVEQMIQDAYFNEKGVKTEWREEFKISDNKITGKLCLVGDNGEEFEIIINTNVFNKIALEELKDEDTNYGYYTDYYQSDEGTDPDDFDFDDNEDEGPITKILRRKARRKVMVAGADDAIPTIWIILIIVGAAILVAGSTVVIIVLVKRKKKKIKGV